MGTSEEAKEIDLGSGSVGKLLFNLAIPAITTQIISVLYNIVNRICIGHLPGVGANTLTGVDVTSPIIMAISASTALVNMDDAPRASVMLGKSKKDEAENILGDCTTTLIAVAVVLTTFFLTFGYSILLMFGASASTIEYGWAYMQIHPLGTTFVRLALGLNAFINAQGYAETGIFTILVGTVCNVILGPIPMPGFRMDMRGTALAIIISQGILAAWVVLFLFSRKSYPSIHPHYMKLKTGVLMPTIALRAIPFVMRSTGSILNIYFSALLLRYGGDMTMGAMTIMGSVVQFSLLPLQGLAQDAQPIISFNFGTGKLDRVSRAFCLLPVSCTCYSTAIWVVSVFAPSVFIRIFTKDPALTVLSTWSIYMYMAAILLPDAQLACQQTFIAPGNSKTSLFLALLRRIILLIPLIYVPSAFFENKVFTIFLTKPITDTSVVCTTVSLFITSFRELKREMG